MANISVPSVAGTLTVIPVTGQNLIYFADQLQANLLALWNNGANPVVSLDGASTATGGQTSLFSIDQNGSDTVPSGGGNVTVGADYTNVTGSGDGDTVIFAGGFVGTQDSFSASTYNDVGGNNEILFAAGNNTYNGASATGDDTIVGGSGHDNIITGSAGDATVFGGVGGSNITLNDTTTGAGYNDVVWSNNGESTINAAGAADAVGLTDNNNVVTDTSTIAGGTLSVLTAGDNNTVLFGADTGTNNYIQGGAGSLVYVGESTVPSSVQITAGTGPAYVYGSTSENISYTSTLADSSSSVFIAGSADTINAAGSAGTDYFFTATAADADVSSNNQSITGGSGENIFVTGNGNETLTGGAGSNFYYINATDGSGGNISLADFGTQGNSYYSFDGYSASDIASALADATTVTSNGATSLLVTLSDSTTVTFVGISSASELSGHVIT